MKSQRIFVLLQSVKTYRIIMQKTLMLTKVKGFPVQCSIHLWISFWNIVCMVVTPCAQFSGMFSALGEYSDITVATCNSGSGGSSIFCMLRGVWGLWGVWGGLLSPDSLCWSRDRFQGPGEKTKRLKSPDDVLLNPLRNVERQWHRWAIL